MSFEIYGFADFSEPVSPEVVLKTLVKSTPLGIFKSSEDQLFGFPYDLKPGLHSIVFAIGDSPGSMNAEYLLDFQDYDPSSSIELPLRARERLTLLTNLLVSVVSLPLCTRIAVCITACSQVDSVVELSGDLIKEVIFRDCCIECPPCKAYIFNKLDLQIG